MLTNIYSQSIDFTSILIGDMTNGGHFIFNFEFILLFYILSCLMIGTYYSTRWWLKYLSLLPFFILNSIFFLVSYLYNIYNKYYIILESKGYLDPIFLKLDHLECFYIIDLNEIIQLLNTESFFYLFNENNKIIFLFIVFIIVYLILFLIISLNYFKRENFYQFEYVILFLLLLLAMILILKSSDLLTMYLAIEFQSLILYIFAASKRYSFFSTEAGLKYFIQGAFSSGLLLLGFSFLYGFTGLSTISDFYLFFNQGLNLELCSYYFLNSLLEELDINLFINSIDFMSGGVILGILLILSAFFFKLSIFPFSFWVPDVYEGSSSIITLLFSTLPKLSIFGLFFKLSLVLTFNLSHILNLDLLFYVEWIVACFSIVVGAIGALYQTKIKRILAYSTINHFGLILLALILWTPLSIFSSLFYLFIYSLLNLSFFSIFLVLRKNGNLFKLKSIEELNEIKKDNPLLAFLLSIILFSIGGIPPLLGFFSKFFIMSSVWIESYQLISHSYIYLFGIICVILSSVISVFYYIRIIRKIYFNNSNFNLVPQQLINLNYIDSIVISILFIVNLLALFYIKDLMFIIWHYSLYLETLLF